MSKAEVVEADLEEDSGYFYQRLGELRFSPEVSCASGKNQHGHHRHLAVASKHGVVAFADQKGGCLHEEYATFHLLLMPFFVLH